MKLRLRDDDRCWCYIQIETYLLACLTFELCSHGLLAQPILSHVLGKQAQTNKTHRRMRAWLVMAVKVQVS